MIEKETDGQAWMLGMHLGTMVFWLKQLSPEHWDWRPDVAAPTARILATHTYQWLVCDRQHITEPDIAKHEDIPPLPDDPEAACAVLTEEMERWDKMIRALTPEELNAERTQFGSGKLNVRWFILHIIQNSIYKNGQLATLYYALGYDGKAPYDAPLPNPIYAEYRAGTLKPE